MMLSIKSRLPKPILSSEGNSSSFSCPAVKRQLPTILHLINKAFLRFFEDFNLIAPSGALIYPALFYQQETVLKF